MFQSFDTTNKSDGIAPPAALPTARAQWLALLARAPLALLSADWLPQGLQWRWLRAPETGLMMVQGRVGGSGERFNTGELTLTRCTLRMAHAQAGSDTATVGVGYVLGRSHAKARQVALADALLQQSEYQEQIERDLLQPIRAHLNAERVMAQQRADSTKVDFFTVARESDAGEFEEQEDMA